MLYVLLTATGYVIVCSAADATPHCGYMPTAIQYALSPVPQLDFVAAINELRLTDCADTGYCQ